tara:strand:- start:145 stop:309 length:165 start_codon:yes stop_codon:yes gene_type:complete
VATLRPAGELEAWRLVLVAWRCGIVGQKKFLYGAAGVFFRILLKWPGAIAGARS